MNRLARILDFPRRLVRLMVAAARMPGDLARIARDIETLAHAPPQPPPIVTVTAPKEPASPWRDIQPNSEHALFKALSDAAMARTVEIVRSEMSDAVLFLDHVAFLRFCLTRANKTGAHLEFGVFSGTTINLLAEMRPDARFDGFDSFRGLPSDWSGWMEFDFNRNGAVPEVRPNVTLHVGLFEDTLPPFAAGLEGVSFLHVDCDIYASTVTVFRHLAPCMLPGCVIVFDEYFAYPGFEAHERRAFVEFIAQTGRKATWLACCGQRAACVN